MQISVVIPTFNRAKTLKECLHALFKQDFPEKDYEVIVVDDGSNDDTKEVVHHFKEDHPNVHYIHQPNQGQGIARNTGVTHAKGDIVCFIGDDIIVCPEFLTGHMRMHLRHTDENAAVLGFVGWHPKLTITPFMNWLTNGSSILGRFGGHQFAYEKLRDKTEADYNFFYTSNISLKRTLADKYPFDPSFSGYGWEDIELGYRLHNRVGLRIYYNASAVGFHDHALDEASLKKRMRSIGSSAKIFHKKYPELNKVPQWWKKLVFWLISNELSIWILEKFRDMSQGKWTGFYYYALSKKYFLQGLAGKKETETPN
jgi:glycosyltransferase involved in cell wall biosynthesis